MDFMTYYVEIVPIWTVFISDELIKWHNEYLSSILFMDFWKIYIDTWIFFKITSYLKI